MLKLQCFMIKAYCVLFLGGTERVIMPQNLNNNVNGNGYAPTTNENIHKTVVGIIITLIVASMIAAICIAAFNSSRNSNNSNVAKKENYKVVINDLRGKDSPANFNKTGGILTSKLGYNKPVDGAPTVALYFDPLCPGCGQFSRNVDKYLINMTKAGQINLEIHPMSFLDAASSDHYSSRVSGGLAYIAVNDPDPIHMLEFMNNMFAEDFQPEEGSGYKPVSDQKIADLAVKSGVLREIADEAFTRKYVEWQNRVNTAVPDYKNLWNVSGPNKGGMTTPTVTVNNKIVDLYTASEKNMDSLDAILKSIDLSKDEIGVEGKMPKVKANEEPRGL